MKAYREVEVRLHSLKSRMGSPRSRSGQFEVEINFQPLAGVEPRIVRHVALSLYQLSQPSPNYDRQNYRNNNNNNNNNNNDNNNNSKKTCHKYCTMPAFPNLLFSLYLLQSALSLRLLLSGRTSGHYMGDITQNEVLMLL